MTKAFAVLFLLLAACGSTSSSPAAAPVLPPAPDPCVGDAPWLLAILGELPSKSDYISLESGMSDPQLAPLIASGQGREVDGGSAWLKNVSWSSQEIYEYSRVPNARQKVVVARRVQGKDPRTLGDFGQPPALGAPQTLPSGVVEWPSASPSRSEGHFLYVFPDGTWVIVETWMAPRFRAVFSNQAASPPLPASSPDTYVEYCFPHGGRREVVASKQGGLDIATDHWAMRFKAGLFPSYELAYTFDTPEEAARAEAEQRARCAQKLCKVTSSRVEGRVVRYLARD